MADAEQTILVASPDEDVREVLARVVETASLDAVRLDPDTDVAAALVTSAAHGVVLDLGSGNLGVLQAVRATSDSPAADAVVIVLGTGPAGGRLAWRAGADGYLVRPFAARELQETLASALAANAETRAERRITAAAQLTP